MPIDYFDDACTASSGPTAERNQVLPEALKSDIRQWGTLWQFDLTLHRHNDDEWHSQMLYMNRKR